MRRSASSPMKSRSVSRCTALALLALWTAGCAEPNGDRQEEQARPAVGADSEPASADYLLKPEDFDKFRPGRSKDDILKDLRWRGNFEMATEHQGENVSAISYGLSWGPHGNIWAIFVDGKFQKFVPWPEWWREEPTLKLGEFRPRIQAFESEPLKISDLKVTGKEEREPPTQTDPGLTAAWLLLRKDVEAAHQRDLKRNVALRDQFNAARLKIGMTVPEVESVLKAKPIEAGEIEAGLFRIYGGTESLDVLEALHYSNIVVLFADGKVTGIYSGAMAPGGADWREKLRERFADLPV